MIFRCLSGNVVLLDFFFFLFKMTLENNMPIHYYSMSTLTIFTCKVMNFELKTFISFFIVKNLILKS